MSEAQESIFKTNDDVCEQFPSSDTVVVFVNNQQSKAGKFKKSTARCLCLASITGGKLDEGTKDYTQYFYNYKTFAELKAEKYLKIFV